MEKKTIIIISIIATIISMIYLLLQYFGLLRYTSMYLFSHKSYVENYTKLDRIEKTKRVVISLTTTPEKMKHLTPVINSLLDQTVKVDLISLVVPDEPEYEFPKNLKDSVTIFKTQQNNGCLTPLLSSLIREEESTTIIIILGDNQIYGKDFIETLLEESVNNPTSIIYMNKKDLIDMKRVVLFKTEFFDSDFFDITENDDPEKWVNDYFKNHEKKKISYFENYKAL